MGALPPAPRSRVLRVKRRRKRPRKCIRKPVFFRARSLSSSVPPIFRDKVFFKPLSFVNAVLVALFGFVFLPTLVPGSMEPRPICEGSGAQRLILDPSSVPNDPQQLGQLPDLQSLLDEGYEIVPPELHCLMTDFLNRDSSFSLDPESDQGGETMQPDGVNAGSPSMNPSVPTTDSASASSPGLLDALLPEGPSEPPDPLISRKTEEGWRIGLHADNRAAELLVQEIVKKNQSRFAFKLSDITGYKGRVGSFHIAPPNASMEIPASVAGQIRRPRRRGPMEIGAMGKHLSPNYDAGFIVESFDAVIAHEVVVVAKRDAQGGWTDARVCVDYGAGTGGVNKYTPKDPYQLPLPDDLFASVEGRCDYLSLCDLKSGFFQIPIPEHLQHLTSFWWDRDGRGPKLYKWTVSPFGLSGMPSFFQRIMDTMIADAGLQDYVKVYLDDCLIHTSTVEEHLSVLQRFFDMLEANGMKLHPGKSIFCAREVDFLGHTLSRHGKMPSAAKVAAIRALPTPVDVHSLRRLLGFCSFYRDYTPKFTEHAHSLYQLLQKGAAWEWTPERDKDWHALKEELCKEGNALRRADRSKPFILHTDWSHHGMSAVLNQLGDDGKEYLISCASRSCNKAESKYGSFRGELLAVVFGMRTFRYYLLGSPLPTTLYTDHKGLMWLMANKDLEGQYQRWQVILSAYDFIIKYKKGELHDVADVPSRFPLPSTADNTGAREPLDADRPTRVDLSSLTPEEREIALAELAEFNAVAAASLLTKALSLSATPEWFRSSHSEELRDGVPPTDALFTPEFQSHLDTLTSRAAQMSDFTPCSLSTHLSYGDFHESPQDSGLEPAEEYDFSSGCVDRLLALRGLAANQVEKVRYELNRLPSDKPTSNLCFVPSDHPDTPAWLTLLHGRVSGVDSHPAPDSCLQQGHNDGLTVLELFGGMASGLEMCLRNGFAIRRYIYCDKDDNARAIAQYRLQGFSFKYPDLLPPSAWESAFATLPQDVYKITPDHLRSASCQDGSQWFVIAGFECQDLSPAGSGAGLKGSRSNSFYPLLQIIGELQHLQRRQLPPLYLVENTAMQCTQTVRPEVQASFDEICNRLGHPVVLDAAQVGSYAHRLRNYWTNLCDSAQLQVVLDSYDRDPTLALTDILEPGRTPQVCSRLHPEPWYPANARGAPLRVLPTLVATIDSYSFRNGQPGMVHDVDGNLVPLTIEEREAALGFSPWCTAAPGASFQARHKATGSCFDINALSTLMATAIAIRTRDSIPFHSFLTNVSVEDEADEPEPLYASVFPIAVASDAQEEYSDSFQSSFQSGQAFLRHAALSAVAVGQDAAESPNTSTDVWEDIELLAYLHGDPALSVSERVRKRASRFRWTSGRLYRCMADGTLREVPPPADRSDLIRSLHESTGHWGRRRTTHLVMQTYWFPNLYNAVRDVVRACPACSRQQAVFNSQQPTLNPLPIRGFMYRWGLDLAGPFTLSNRGIYLYRLPVTYTSSFALSISPNISKYSRSRTNVRKRLHITSSTVFWPAMERVPK